MDILKKSFDFISRKAVKTFLNDGLRFLFKPLKDGQVDTDGLNVRLRDVEFNEISINNTFLSGSPVSLVRGSIQHVELCVPVARTSEETYVAPSLSLQGVALTIRVAPSSSHPSPRSSPNHPAPETADAVPAFSAGAFVDTVAHDAELQESLRGTSSPSDPSSRPSLPPELPTDIADWLNLVLHFVSHSLHRASFDATNITISILFGDEDSSAASVEAFAHVHTIAMGTHCEADAPAPRRSEQGSEAIPSIRKTIRVRGVVLAARERSADKNDGLLEDLLVEDTAGNGAADSAESEEGIPIAMAPHVFAALPFTSAVEVRISVARDALTDSGTPATTLLRPGASAAGDAAPAPTARSSSSPWRYVPCRSQIVRHLEVDIPPIRVVVSRHHLTSVCLLRSRLQSGPSGASAARIPPAGAAQAAHPAGLVSAIDPCSLLPSTSFKVSASEIIIQMHHMCGPPVPAAHLAEHWNEVLWNTISEGGATRMVQSLHSIERVRSSRSPCTETGGRSGAAALFRSFIPTGESFIAPASTVDISASIFSMHELSGTPGRSSAPLSSSSLISEIGGPMTGFLPRSVAFVIERFVVDSSPSLDSLASPPASSAKHPIATLNIGTARIVDNSRETPLSPCIYPIAALPKSGSSVPLLSVSLLSAAQAALCFRVQGIKRAVEPLLAVRIKPIDAVFDLSLVTRLAHFVESSLPIAEPADASIDATTTSAPAPPKLILLAELHVESLYLRMLVPAIPRMRAYCMTTAATSALLHGLPTPPRDATLCHPSLSECVLPPESTQISLWFSDLRLQSGLKPGLLECSCHAPAPRRRNPTKETSPDRPDNPGDRSVHASSVEITRNVATPAKASSCPRYVPHATAAALWIGKDEVISIAEKLYFCTRLAFLENRCGGMSPPTTSAPREFYPNVNPTFLSVLKVRPVCSSSTSPREREHSGPIPGVPEPPKHHSVEGGSRALLVSEGPDNAKLEELHAASPISVAIKSPVVKLSVNSVCLKLLIGYLAVAAELLAPTPPSVESQESVASLFDLATSAFYKVVDLFSLRVSIGLLRFSFATPEVFPASIPSPPRGGIHLLTGEAGTVKLNTVSLWSRKDEKSVKRITPSSSDLNALSSLYLLLRAKTLRLRDAGYSFRGGAMVDPRPILRSLPADPSESFQPSCLRISYAQVACSLLGLQERRLHIGGNRLALDHVSSLGGDIWFMNFIKLFADGCEVPPPPPHWNPATSCLNVPATVASKAEEFWSQLDVLTAEALLPSFTSVKSMDVNVIGSELVIVHTPLSLPQLRVVSTVGCFALTSRASPASLSSNISLHFQDIDLAIREGFTSAIDFIEFVERPTIGLFQVPFVDFIGELETFGFFRVARGAVDPDRDTVLSITTLDQAPSDDRPSGVPEVDILLTNATVVLFGAADGLSCLIATAFAGIDGLDMNCLTPRESRKTPIVEASISRTGSNAEVGLPGASILEALHHAKSVRLDASPLLGISFNNVSRAAVEPLNISCGRSTGASSAGKCITIGLNPTDAIVGSRMYTSIPRKSSDIAIAKPVEACQYVLNDDVDSDCEFDPSEWDIVGERTDAPTVARASEYSNAIAGLNKSFTDSSDLPESPVHFAPRATPPLSPQEAQKEWEDLTGEVDVVADFGLTPGGNVELRLQVSDAGVAIVLYEGRDLDVVVSLECAGSFINARRNRSASRVASASEPTVIDDWVLEQAAPDRLAVMSLPFVLPKTTSWADLGDDSSDGGLGDRSVHVSEDGVPQHMLSARNWRTRIEVNAFISRCLLDVCSEASRIPLRFGLEVSTFDVSNFLAACDSSVASIISRFPIAHSQYSNATLSRLVAAATATSNQPVLQIRVERRHPSNDVVPILCRSAKKNSNFSCLTETLTDEYSIHIDLVPFRVALDLSTSNFIASLWTGAVNTFPKYLECAVNTSCESGITSAGLLGGADVEDSALDEDTPSGIFIASFVMSELMFLVDFRVVEKIVGLKQLPLMLCRAHIDGVSSDFLFDAIVDCWRRDWKTLAYVLASTPGALVGPVRSVCSVTADVASAASAAWTATAHTCARRTPQEMLRDVVNGVGSISLALARETSSVFASGAETSAAILNLASAFASGVPQVYDLATSAPRDARAGASKALATWKTGLLRASRTLGTTPRYARQYGMLRTVPHIVAAAVLQPAACA